MGLLTNPLVVVIKLEATKCCLRLLHFRPLCDVLRVMEAYDQDQKFLRGCISEN